MANEITSQKITISLNKGLTHALKNHVQQNNLTMSDGSISAKEWVNTMDKLAEINEKRKANGGQTIFTGGTDKSRAGWHSSFVVKPDQEIEFTKEEMAELYSAMGVSLGASQVEKTTESNEEATETVANGPKNAEEAPVGIEAEKQPLTKAEKKALKEKLKREKIHDKAAIDVTVPRNTEHRAKAQRKFTKANKALISMAYSIQKPYIKEQKKVINGVEYTVKTAKFDNGAQNKKLDRIAAEGRKLLFGGSRYVTAMYDQNGEMVSIEVNSDRLRKNAAPDVKFTKDAAYADTKRKQDGYEVKITEGFDFEETQKVVEKIFAKEAK